MTCLSSQVRRHLAASSALLCALLATATPAQTQKYPERPVRIVSVTSPGTGVDDFTRLLAKDFNQKSGQSFVVENRPGANTIIACDHVAKAAPDGYTLLLAAASSMSANPFLFKNLPYNPQRDFVPIARLSALPVVLVVSASSPYQTVADLTAAARAKPRTLNYGTSSAGYRVMLAAFNESARIQSLDVPYKAMSNLLPDLIGGVLDYAVLEVSAAVPLVQGHKLRALAILSESRQPAMADVPTLAEAGVSGVTLTSWIGLFAPAGTPPAIVEQLSRWSLQFVNSPEAARHFAQRGTMPSPGSGPELSKTIIRDQAQWKRLISVAGIQPE